MRSTSICQPGFCQHGFRQHAPTKLGTDESANTRNLPTKTIPTKIRRLKISRGFPMDLTTPPLKVTILPESNPLKSRILVRRLAASHNKMVSVITRLKLWFAKENRNCKAVPLRPLRAAAQARRPRRRRTRSGHLPPRASREHNITNY